MNHALLIKSHRESEKSDMNAKTCKQLRRVAERATIGRPFVQYFRHKDGSIRIRSSSTRGKYRELKKALRR